MKQLHNRNTYIVVFPVGDGENHLVNLILSAIQPNNTVVNTLRDYYSMFDKYKIAHAPSLIATGIRLANCSVEDPAKLQKYILRNSTSVIAGHADEVDFILSHVQSISNVHIVLIHLDNISPNGKNGMDFLSGRNLQNSYNMHGMQDNLLPWVYNEQQLSKIFGLLDNSIINIPINDLFTNDVSPILYRLTKESNNKLIFDYDLCQCLHSQWYNELIR